MEFLNMKLVDRKNCEQFLKHYCDFHDGFIKAIENIDEESKIIVLFLVWTAGTPVLQRKGAYEEKQTELKLVFKNVSTFAENNPYEIDHIDYAYIDFFNKDGKNSICFSLYDEDPDNDPYLYIICEKIEYEENRTIR